MKTVINRGFKARLYPTEEQQVLFTKTFGCCRFIYNKILNDKIEYYKAYGKSKTFTPALYKEDYIWLKEVDSLALANAQLHVQKAFKSFFEHKTSFPVFKSKHKSKQSYTTNNQNGSIRIENNTLKLPKVGFVKIKQYRKLPTDAIIKSATISKSASGNYFCSILLEYEIDIPDNVIADESNTIAFDYSSPSIYIDSNNYSPDINHWYRKNQDKLANEQRKLSHMKKGSNNYIKQCKRIAKLHERIANQRADFCHQQSRKIANSYNAVVFEDIDLHALAQALKLGKNTNDNGFGMFRNFLKYKMEEQGKYFIKVSRWYPSTKTCGACGYINKNITLKERHWVCPECGSIHDRDYNAALNIKKEGLRLIA